MCAINGFTFPSKRLIKLMNQSLIHRGPDHGGEYVDANISLGSRRLSIIDLSSKGHMPMSSQRGRYWIVYNGEVYNFKSIRHNLIKKGYKFKSQTDTEVILKGYQEFGSKIVRKLDGMFALAIWDAKEKTLFLARDRIGIKPLYYHYQDNQLIFSSEIKAILKHNISRKVNIASLNLYFRLLYVPSPSTMFEGINKLPPGHFMMFSHKRLVIKSYWSPPTSQLHLPEPQLINLLKHRLKRAVSSNLISDRPVGIFLSGGIDSSLILALATQVKKSPIKTYTVGFKVAKESAKFNQDLTAARLTSNLFKSDHHELLISAQDVINNFSKIIYHLDEPIANPTQAATYMLSRLASKDVAVVLGGDGGDELFLGYDRYRHLRLVQLYQQIPRPIRHQIPLLVGLLSPRLADLSRKASFQNPAKLQLLLVGQSEQLLSQLLSRETNHAAPALEFFQSRFQSQSNFGLDEFPQADLQTWLTDESLLKSDKMTMANSLEQRVPILSNAVVDLALRVPFTTKHSLTTSKRLMRLVSQEFLPETITNAPKWGWFSPISKWLRTGLKGFAQESLSANNLKYVADYIDPAFARKLLSEHLQGQYHPHTIWSIITFSAWHHTFITKKQH